MRRHSPFGITVAAAPLDQPGKGSPGFEPPFAFGWPSNKAFATLANVCFTVVCRVIEKREQASANRWHLEVRLEKSAQIDRQLTRCLKAAYEIAGPRS